MDIEAVLSRLEGVRGQAPQWLAKCPSHEDRSPSLSIREADDGKILINCFAGCGASEVLDALGLAWSDLFPDGIPKPSKPTRPRWDYRLVLKSLMTETTIILMAAKQLAEGEPLNAEDLGRVKEAYRRITHISGGVS